MGVSTITYLTCDGVNGKACGKELRTSRDGVMLVGRLRDGGPVKGGSTRALLVGSETSQGEHALCAACLASLLDVPARPPESDELKILRGRADDAEKRVRGLEETNASLTRSLQTARSERDDAKSELSRRSYSSAGSSTYDSYEQTTWERRGGGASGPQSPPELPHYVGVALRLSGL